MARISGMSFQNCSILLRELAYKMGLVQRMRRRKKRKEAEFTLCACYFVFCNGLRDTMLALANWWHWFWCCSLAHRKRKWLEWADFWISMLPFSVNEGSGVGGPRSCLEWRLALSRPLLCLYPRALSELKRVLARIVAVFWTWFSLFPRKMMKRALLPFLRSRICMSLGGVTSSEYVQVPFMLCVGGCRHYVRASSIERSFFYGWFRRDFERTSFFFFVGGVFCYGCGLIFALHQIQYSPAMSARMRNAALSTHVKVCWSSSIVSNVTHCNGSVEFVRN